MTTPRQLAQRLVTRQAPGVLTRHQGVITAASGTTVSIELDGVSTVITGVRYFSWYAPTVGDTVEVFIDDTDLIVMGKLA